MALQNKNPVRTAYINRSRDPQKKKNLFKFVTNFICQKEAEVKTFRHQEKKNKKKNKTQVH